MFTPQRQTNDTHEQNRSSLKNLSHQCDTFQLSNRAGAAVATAALKDYCIITEKDTRNIIDRSKLS